MDPELVRAIKPLKETQPDAWRVFKNFLGGERDQSLMDFTNYETIQNPQLLANLSGMIGQTDRIVRVIFEAEESNG